jgi:hypothetical protein
METIFKKQDFTETWNQAYHRDMEIQKQLTVSLRLKRFKWVGTEVSLFSFWEPPKEIIIR